MARWIPFPEDVRAVAAGMPGAILLETLRFDAANRHSYLFQDPLRILTAATLAKRLNLDEGYRVVINNGPFGGESVPNTILLRGNSRANSTMRD